MVGKMAALTELPSSSPGSSSSLGAVGGGRVLLSAGLKYKLMIAWSEAFMPATTFCPSIGSWIVALAAMAVGRTVGGPTGWAGSAWPWSNQCLALVESVLGPHGIQSSSYHAPGAKAPSSPRMPSCRLQAAAWRQRSAAMRCSCGCRRSYKQP
jgi:hypothetical protein